MAITANFLHSRFLIILYHVELYLIVLLRVRLTPGAKRAFGLFFSKKVHWAKDVS
jgi:hypothetical protein